MVEMRKCACGCGREVKRTGRSGPAPTYASNACRMRALRQRRATAELTALPDVLPLQPVTPTAASVDDQVARSLLEARATGFALQRLGTQARPELAWRCTKLGDAIVAALHDTFPETER